MNGDVALERGWEGEMEGVPGEHGCVGGHGIVGEQGGVTGRICGGYGRVGGMELGGDGGNCWLCHVGGIAGCEGFIIRPII